MPEPIENMDGELVDVLTWQNSGLSTVEIRIMRNVAHQYPDGAYAKFVRMLDRQANETVADDGSSWTRTIRNH